MKKISIRAALRRTFANTLALTILLSLALTTRLPAARANDAWADKVSLTFVDPNTDPTADIRRPDDSNRFGVTDNTWQDGGVSFDGIRVALQMWHADNSTAQAVVFEDKGPSQDERHAFLAGKIESSRDGNTGYTIMNMVLASEFKAGLTGDEDFKVTVTYFDERDGRSLPDGTPDAGTGFHILIQEDQWRTAAPGKIIPGNSGEWKAQEFTFQGFGGTTFGGHDIALIAEEPVWIHSIVVEKVIEPDTRTEKEKLQELFDEWETIWLAGNAGDTYTDATWAAFDTAMGDVDTLLTGTAQDDSVYGAALVTHQAAITGLKKNKPTEWQHTVSVTFEESSFIINTSGQPIRAEDTDHDAYDGLLFRENIDDNRWGQFNQNSGQWAYKSRSGETGAASEMFFISDEDFREGGLIDDFKISIEYFDGEPMAAGGMYIEYWDSAVSGPGSSVGNLIALGNTNAWKTADIIAENLELGRWGSADFTVRTNDDVFIRSVTISRDTTLPGGNPWDALEDLYNSLEGTPKGDYEDDSWGRFTTALSVADGLISGQSDDSTAILNARTELQNAYNALEIWYGIRLKTLFDANKGKWESGNGDERYTGASWTGFDTEMGKTEALLNTLGSPYHNHAAGTKTQMDDLQSAVDGLRLTSGVNPGSGGDWANRVDVTFSETALNRITSANEADYDGIDFDPQTWSASNSMEEAVEYEGKWAYQAGLTEHWNSGTFDILWLGLDSEFRAGWELHPVKVTVNYFDTPSADTPGHYNDHAFAVSYKADDGGPSSPGTGNIIGGQPGSVQLQGTNTWETFSVVIPAGEMFSSNSGSGHMMGFWGITIHAAQPVWIHSVTIEKEIGAAAKLQALVDLYNDLLPNQGDYSDASWGAFDTAMTEATGLLSGGGSPADDEFAIARDKLALAHKGLTLGPRAALDALVNANLSIWDNGSGNDGDTFESGWDAFDAAMTEAIALLAKTGPVATEPELETMFTTLNDAIKGLVRTTVSEVSVTFAETGQVNDGLAITRPEAALQYAEHEGYWSLVADMTETGGQNTPCTKMVLTGEMEAGASAWLIVEYWVVEDAPQNQFWHAHHGNWTSAAVGAAGQWNTLIMRLNDYAPPGNIVFEAHGAQMYIRKITLTLTEPDVVPPPGGYTGGDGEPVPIPVPEQGQWGDVIYVNFNEATGTGEVGAGSPGYQGLRVRPNHWAPGGSIGAYSMIDGRRAYRHGTSDTVDGGQGVSIFGMWFGSDFTAGLQDSDDIHVTVVYYNEADDGLDSNAFKPEYALDNKPPPAREDFWPGDDHPRSDGWEAVEWTIQWGDIKSGHWDGMIMSVSALKPVWINMIVIEKGSSRADTKTRLQRLYDQWSAVSQGNITDISWGHLQYALTAAHMVLNTSPDPDPEHTSYAEALAALRDVIANLERNPRKTGYLRYDNVSGAAVPDKNGVDLDFGGSLSPNSSLGIAHSKGAVGTPSVSGGSWGNPHIGVILDADYDTGVPADYLVTIEYYADTAMSGAIGFHYAAGGYSSYTAAKAGVWDTAYIVAENLRPDGTLAFYVELKTAPIYIHAVTVTLFDPGESDDPDDFGTPGPDSDWSEEVSLWWESDGLHKDGLAYGDQFNLVKYELAERDGRWGAKTIPVSFGTGTAGDTGYGMADPAESYIMFFNLPDEFKSGYMPPEIEVMIEYWNHPLTARNPVGGQNFGPYDRQFGFFLQYLKDGNLSGMADQAPFGTSIVATGTEEWMTETLRLANPAFERGFWSYDLSLNVQEGMIIRSVTVRKPQEIAINTDGGDFPHMYYAGESIELPVSVTNTKSSAQDAVVTVRLYDYNDIFIAEISDSKQGVLPGETVVLTPTFAPGSVPKGSYHAEFTSGDGVADYATVKDFFTVVEELDDLVAAGIIGIDSFGVASHFLWHGDEPVRGEGNHAGESPLEFEERRYRDYDQPILTAIKVMKAAGITTVRDEYTWFEVEQSNMNQEYRFTKSRWISLMVQNGITPIIVLNYGHDYWGWDPDNGTEYSGKTGTMFEQFPKAGYPLPNNPYLAGQPQALKDNPRDYIQACGDYAYALLRHFNDPTQPYYAETSQLTRFEIWNEPNLHSTADIFFPVLKELYERANQAFADAYADGDRPTNDRPYIIGAAVCMYAEPWIDRLFRGLDGWKYMDAFSYHYPDHPQRGKHLIQATEIQDLVAQVSASKSDDRGSYGPQGKRMPIWITELGDSNYRIPELTTAAWYAQYYLEHRAYWDSADTLNEALYLYVLQNYTMMNAVQHQVQDHGITYLEGPFAPKPAVSALNAAAWLTRGAEQGKRYDGLSFPLRAELQSNAPAAGVRAYTFYGTADSAMNAGDQIIALYAFDGVVPVSIDLSLVANNVGTNFILYDGYGNAVSAALTGGKLALTLTELPTYIVVPAAYVDKSKDVILGSALYATDSGVPTVETGGILTFNINRFAEAQNVSGIYSINLPRGWTLVDSGNNPISQVSFGTGSTDQIHVRAPDISGMGKFFISIEDGSGKVYANLSLEATVLETLLVETYPVMRDGGIWEVEVKITNNTGNLLPGGNITVNMPSAAGTKPYADVPARSSVTVSFPYPELNPDSPMPFRATLSGGAEGSIDRTLSALGVLYADGLNFNKDNPDWAGIPWAEAIPFYPDYENYGNVRSGNLPPRTWYGTDDLDFTGRTLYDEEYLYIQIDVTDDRHVLFGDINNSWQNDSLQISIDPMRGPGTARDVAGQHAAGGYRGEISIIAAIFQSGHYGMAINYNTVPGLTARNLRDSRINVTRSEVSKKTSYSMAFAWADILMAEQLAAGFNPANIHLGFAATVNDSDRGTDRGWMNYMDGIAFGKDARLFGDLTLAPSNIAFALPAPTYTVLYNRNGGDTSSSVPTDGGRYEEGETVNVLFSPAPSRTGGFAFAGWATAPSGTAVYTSGGTENFVMGDENVTLYAVWLPTGDAPAIFGPDSMLLTTGYTATSTEVYDIMGTPAPGVSITASHPDNGGLITWNAAAKTLDIAAGLLPPPGEAAGYYEVTLTATNTHGTASLTFTLTVAEPENGRFFVNYSPNTTETVAGTVPTDDTPYGSGELVTVLFPSPALTREGYIFTGWATSPTGDAVYTASGTNSFNINRNISLYAVWILDSESVVTEEDYYIPPIVPDPESGTINVGDVILDVDVNDGIGSISPTEEDVNTIIEEIFGNTEEGEIPTTPVIFDLSGKDVTGFAFNLHAVERFAEAELTVVIILPNAEITLDTEALALLADTDQPGTTLVTVAAVPVEETELTKMQTAQVDGYEVIVLDLNVYVGDDKVNTPMSVTLTYDLKEGEDPRAVRAWHLDERGRKTRLAGVYDPETGQITFFTAHQSIFAIGYDEDVAKWINVFSDLNEADWYYDAVAYVNERYDMFAGIGGGRLGGDIEMTRAMFVTILWKLEGMPIVTGEQVFTDAAPGAWYYDAVQWAYANGVTAGTGDGKFTPERNMTRQELATLLHNYAVNFKGCDIPENREPVDFSDPNYIDVWAENAIQLLRDAGVFDEDQDDAFNPHDEVTRADAAQIFKNFLRFVVGKE
ncbi:MAG: S-layer homology domain-containing protein [Oscillospiraceae bacterium]|nr:S-layer homology domain-containing protein [Oscillospiraceae bacterium]